MSVDVGISVLAEDPVGPDGWDRLEAMAQALADAVDAKGRYRPSHCRGVSRLTVLVARTLGITGASLIRLQLAGLLHDVGKLQTPDAILLKPNHLEISEYEIIKLHSATGHSMIVALGLPDEARWVLHHHERADGTGYPSGLRGDAIPLGSRILAVADAYDCITSRRIYTNPRTKSYAIGELRDHAGQQFDPDCVEALAVGLREK